jgi:diacylglycerol kinase (ATP)
VRLILLHNPLSGDEAHDRDSLEGLLAQAGHDVRYQSMEDDDWRTALDESFDLIVVAGGDGSVRKLFTAVHESSILALVLPVGSANNVARTIGLDLESAAALLRDGEPLPQRRFDLWDVSSTWGTSPCVEAVGGGLFPEVLSDAEEASGKPSGPANVDFGLQLLGETLADTAAHPWMLEIDGTRFEEELIGVEAMNIREIGANLTFAPDADSGDGVLDVVLVRPEDREALAAFVASRLRDDEATAPTLTVHRGHHVVLEPPTEARLHVDDVLPAWDLTTTSWVEITAATAHVDVVAPAGGPS